MDALPRGFEEGAEVGDRRTLAVGAGDMDYRWQPVLRAAHALEQPLYAIQGEIDELGMKRQKTLQDLIRARHGPISAGWLGRAERLFGVGGGRRRHQQIVVALGGDRHVPHGDARGGQGHV